MSTARENLSSLTFTDYDIAGNVFRAYYDTAHKLVFILDNTKTEQKSNALLIINPIGNRKWDDILSNDYAVDLETVRPKKNNKYQKLDIEYSGLSVYDKLIHDYESDNDLTNALSELSRFRIESVRHAMSDRLKAAQKLAEKSRDTIEKTTESLADLNTTVKELRTKLSQQRHDIGREPTKKTAAKILRTEAQIDATNDKIRRAQRRLANAEKRLATAQEDAAIAQQILNESPEYETLEPVISEFSIPETEVFVSSSAPRFTPPVTNLDDNTLLVPPTPVAPETDETEDAEETAETDETEYISEIPKFEPEYTEINTNLRANTMAEDDVKPLLDNDPEILDEEIAFKPIEFETPQLADHEPVIPSNSFDTINSVESEPMFTPPVSSIPEPIDITPITPNIPVTDEYEENITETISEPQPYASAISMPDAPVLSTDSTYTENNPMPEISPAPISSDFRPASPISGTTPVAPMPDNIGTPSSNNGTRRPAILYYIMLLALIAMSIFTLWLYQEKSNGTNTPDLTKAVKQPDITEQIPTTPTPTEVAPTSVSLPESEPVIITEYAPLPTEWTESAPAPVVVTPESVPVSKSVIIAGVIPIDTQQLANKPIYNVSTADDVFVAAQKYIADLSNYAAVQPEPVPVTAPTKSEYTAEYTETIVKQQTVQPYADETSMYYDKAVDAAIAAPTYEPEPVAEYDTYYSDSLSDTLQQVTAQDIPVQNYNPAPVNNYVAHAPVTESEPVLMAVTAQEFAVEPDDIPDYQLPAVQESGGESCADGNLPDINGCCSGEVYTDMEDGTFACCTPDGIDCFPPMN